MPRARSDLTRSVFSTILRIYRIGNLHGVTICRELSDSDQIITCEHGGTDTVPGGAGHKSVGNTAAREPTGLSSLGVGSSPSGGHSLLALP